jgi:hypothetical protein
LAVGKGRVEDRVVLAQDLDGEPGRAEPITVGDGVGACWVGSGLDELGTTSAGSHTWAEELASRTLDTRATSRWSACSG